MGGKDLESRYVADLRRLKDIEVEARSLQTKAMPFLVAGLFLALTAVGVFGGLTGSAPSVLVMAAAVIGGYMALNIGAHDVANNMGPAVGGRAITVLQAVVIAAICEAAGAMIAGGEVVSTVATGVVAPAAIGSLHEFLMVMMAALLAGALWINLATILNAPVSSTHSIIGGIIGAGAMAAGPGVVAWPMLGAIAASWVISPVMGGAISAALLFVIRTLVFDKEDRLAAARRWVPLIVSLMTTAFAVYLCQKVLRRFWSPEPVELLGVALVFFPLSMAVCVPYIRRRTAVLSSRKKDVRTLFRLPLVMGAALLSFAHGANDVANAIGPVAAIASLSRVENLGHVIAIPFWVMMIGAFGISLGLTLFGMRLINVVGEKITRLNPVRAYCVVFSSAVTVLVATGFGLPVSSTHIAIGAIFGVGFLREFMENPRRRKKGKTTLVNATPDAALLQGVIRRKRMLVRRRFLFSIASAWVVTVPATAAIAAVLFMIVSRL